MEVFDQYSVWRGSCSDGERRGVGCATFAQVNIKCVPSQDADIEDSVTVNVRYQDRTGSIDEGTWKELPLVERTLSVAKQDNSSTAVSCQEN
jgi:hypothetical protein